MQRILVLADNLACPMLDRGEGRIGAGRGAEEETEVLNFQRVLCHTVICGAVGRQIYNHT